MGLGRAFINMMVFINPDLALTIINVYNMLQPVFYLQHFMTIKHYEFINL